MAALGISRPTAIGHLELLWHWAADYCPRGDIGKFTASQLALACAWEGDPAVFLGALISSGWLDSNPEFGIVIHDWPEHVDDFVHAKVARRCETFADGTIPNTRKCNPIEKSKFEEWLKGNKKAPTRRLNGSLKAISRSRSLTANVLTETSAHALAGGEADGDSLNVPSRAVSTNSRRGRARVHGKDVGLHPDLGRFVRAFNASFGRHVAETAALDRAFRRRLADGHEPDALVALPILQAAQGLEQGSAETIIAGWLLRDGTGKYGGQDGGTRNTKDWIGTILGRADETRIAIESPLVDLIAELGLQPTMQRLGVKKRGSAVAHDTHPTNGNGAPGRDLGLEGTEARPGASEGAAGRPC